MHEEPRRGCELIHDSPKRGVVVVQEPNQPHKCGYTVGVAYIGDTLLGLLAHLGWISAEMALLTVLLTAIPVWTCFQIIIPAWRYLQIVVPAWKGFHNATLEIFEHIPCLRTKHFYTGRGRTQASTTTGTGSQSLINRVRCVFLLVYLGADALLSISQLFTPQSPKLSLASDSISDIMNLLKRCCWHCYHSDCACSEAVEGTTVSSN